MYLNCTYGITAAYNIFIDNNLMSVKSMFGVIIFYFVILLLIIDWNDCYLIISHYDYEAIRICVSFYSLLHSCGSCSTIWNSGLWHFFFYICNVNYKKNILDHLRSETLKSITDQLDITFHIFFLLITLNM